MPAKTSSTDKPPADKKQAGDDAINQALASHASRLGALEDRVDMLASRLAAALGLDLSSGT